MAIHGRVAFHPGGTTMNDDVSLQGATEHAARAGAPAAWPRSVAGTSSDFLGVQRDAVAVNVGISLAPPPEVRRAVDVAAERAEWLRRHNRELRFHLDPESRRVQVQVRDLNGRLLREIPPSEALDSMSVDPSART
jgi:hypothetical protein